MYDDYNNNRLDFETLASVIEYVLKTRRKRHITGGILLSVAMLFWGLALTVITVGSEKTEDADEMDKEE